MPPVALSRPRGRASWALGGFDLFQNPLARVPTTQNYALYHSLRETIPLIDAAIVKTAEFVGEPTIDADTGTKQEIEDWLARVSVNRIQTGWKNWLTTWISNGLEYGRAHTEIILAADRKDIYALMELHPATLFLRPAGDRYSVQIVQNQALGTEPVLLNPRLLLNLIHNVQGDDPNGTSLLWGLPFVGEIIGKMINALGESWDRYGVPRYHVNWLPPEGFSDPQGSQSREIMSEISGKFQQGLVSAKEGDIRDFYTSGTVAVNIIGAAGEALDVEAPMRSLIEQVVAKTGIPPFAFGLQWATTERMSAVQAALLSEMIHNLRAEMTGELTYLITLRQQLAGRDTEFKLCWPAPTLLDDLDTSRAALFTEQSRDQLIKNEEALWRAGASDRLQFARQVRPDLAKLDDAELLRRLPDLPQEPPALPAPAPAGGDTAPPRNGSTPQTNLNMADLLGLKNGGH